MIHDKNTKDFLDSFANSLVKNLNKNNDKPEYGKQYALTSGKDKPSILNGNSWKESEVKLGEFVCPVCDKLTIGGACKECDLLVDNL